MNSHNHTLKEGQVYESRYGIYYQILALWDDYVWTHLYYTFTKSQPKENIVTMPRDHYDRLKLKYDVPLSLS